MIQEMACVQCEAQVQIDVAHQMSIRQFTEAGMLLDHTFAMYEKISLKFYQYQNLF